MSGRMGLHAHDKRPTSRPKPTVFLMTTIAATPLPMRMVGVIRNPRSQRNRKATAPPRVPTGMQLAEPATPEALAETLQQFAAQGISHLLIDGGDGTLRDVLGLLPAAYGAAWPTLSLCASGNTNLAAANVGAFQHGSSALEQLQATLNGAAPARVSQCRAIEVRWPDASRTPVFGFFVGCAGYARGVQMATGALRERGWFHGWAVAGALIAAAWQIITGAADSEWQRGSEMALAIDGGRAEAASRFVFLATSLDRLMLGLWPFWSAPDAPKAPLHWLDIRAPAPRFGSALLSLLRGQPKPWVRASSAYRSGTATRLCLTLKEPLIVDGEPYAADANGQIELCAGPLLRFHAPG